MKYKKSLKKYISMEHKYLWALGESSEPIEAISGWPEYNLLREVAKLRKLSNIILPLRMFFIYASFSV